MPANALDGTFVLDFERPLATLEGQIAALEAHQAVLPPGVVGSAREGLKGGQGGEGGGGGEREGAGSKGAPDLGEEVRALRRSHASMLRKIYGGLTPWQVVQVARHPGRPQTLDHLRAFVEDFQELHGDRAFGDDPAVVSGFARIGPHKCVLIGHCKGRTTKQRVACHFGCAHPEGYRKALRCMKLAEKFGLPVVTLIDTPGAYPGIGAERRGQSQAIAVNLMEMSRLRVPVVSVVIGEGGSGGALGLGVADRLAMFEHSWYSVISPEGCAAILWKQSNPQINAAAAAALRLTAQENMKIGVVDAVLPEPLGGAHRDPATASKTLCAHLVRTLRELRRFKIDNLLQKRYQRLRRLGEQAVEGGAP